MSKFLDDLTDKIADAFVKAIRPKPVKIHGMTFDTKPPKIHGKKIKKARGGKIKKGYAKGGGIRKPKG